MIHLRSSLSRAGDTDQSEHSAGSSAAPCKEQHTSALFLAMSCSSLEQYFEYGLVINSFPEKWTNNSAKSSITQPFIALLCWNLIRWCMSCCLF